MGQRPARRVSAAAIAVLVVGVAMSSLGSLLIKNTRDEAREQAFLAEAERARTLISERLVAHAKELLGLRDFTVIGWPVDRVTYHERVSLGLADGLLADAQAVNFIQAVDADGVPALEAAVRADGSIRAGGYPGFAVHPTPAAGEDAFVITYIEPFEGNEPAHGFDIGSDATRRAAVEEARDAGVAIATAPLILVQDEQGERSIALMAAVYDTGDVPVTAPARRRHFVGLVNAVFRTREMLADVVTAPSEVDVEIYDVGSAVEEPAERPDPERLVFDADGQRWLRADGTVDGLHTMLDLDAASRRWRLVVTPTPELMSGGATLGMGIFLAGLVVTVLVAGLTAAISASGRRAQDLADAQTADLQVLIRRAPDATVVVDGEGRIVLASDRVEDLLGFRPGELVGQPVEALVPDRLRSVHQAHRNRFLRVPVAREMGAGLDLSAMRADGTEVEVEISLNPLPAGSIGVVTASLRDVSSRREAQRALEEANTRLREADRAKSAFLGNVTHELQTPLTAIRGFASLLKRGELDDGERELLLDRIEHNAVDLAGLIEEVLAFSRLERGRADVVPEAIELGETVQGVIDRLGVVLATHDVALRSNGPVPAWASREAVARITANLLTNAVRYTPPKTTITVRVEQVGDVACLEVSDQGPGIPQEERKQVFERFWRGSSSEGKGHGTGIGLAIVHDLVDLSGGTVSLDDAPGGGARFTVRFPIDASGSVRRT